MHLDFPHDPEEVVHPAASEMRWWWDNRLAEHMYQEQQRKLRYNELKNQIDPDIKTDKNY